MRALLFEILRACPEVIRNIKTNPKTASTLAQHPQAMTWTKAALLDVFGVVMRQHLEAKFCFFIDGLDEFKGATQDLVGLVRALTSYSDVKICVSSRPWAAFKHAFGEETNTA